MCFIKLTKPLLGVVVNRIEINQGQRAISANIRNNCSLTRVFPVSLDVCIMKDLTPFF